MSCLAGVALLGDRDTGEELIQTGVEMVLLEHILFEGHFKNPGASVEQEVSHWEFGAQVRGQAGCTITGQHLSSEGRSVHGGRGGWNLSAKLRKCKKITQKVSK